MEILKVVGGILSSCWLTHYLCNRWGKTFLVQLENRPIKVIKGKNVGGITAPAERFLKLCTLLQLSLRFGKFEVNHSHCLQYCINTFSHGKWCFNLKKFAWSFSSCYMNSMNKRSGLYLPSSFYQFFLLQFFLCPRVLFL